MLPSFPAPSLGVPTPIPGLADLATIIVILAGLSLGSFKFVITKQANSQAELQIKLLETAIEEYKLDNGEYPLDDNGTNSLYTELYYNGAQEV